MTEATHASKSFAEMFRGLKSIKTMAAKHTTRSPSSSSESSGLSNQELRDRIFANAAVLFPSTDTTAKFEIIYCCKPRLPDPSTLQPRPPWQYAVLIRRSASGSYVPLLKGEVWSTPIPWSLALQGLLDATAAASHRLFVDAVLPAPGTVVEAEEEALPRYENVIAATH